MCAVYGYSRPQTQERNEAQLTIRGRLKNNEKGGGGGGERSQNIAVESNLEVSHLSKEKDLGNTRHLISRNPQTPVMTHIFYTAWTSVSEGMTEIN